jgi:hypothetical protein
MGMNKLDHEARARILHLEPHGVADDLGWKAKPG